MLTERKLTERELDSREVVLKSLLKNKQNLVKRYGKDAEKVMYGIATKKAKTKVEGMNKEKIKELIVKSLTKEVAVTSVDDVIDPAEYGLIGAGYLAGFGKKHSLDLDQLETLGRKIVSSLYKGDFKAAKAKFIKENASQDNAVMELRNIIDELEEKAEEAREIVRQYFPNELSRLDGYGVFNVAYSGNRYDVTLGKFVDGLEDGDYDDLDDEDYPMQEDVSDQNFVKGIEVIKQTLSKEGGAAGLEPLVKALLPLGFKKDEIVDLLKKMTTVKRHRDGDYILLPLEESRNLSDYNEDMEKVIKRGIKRINVGSSDEEDVLYYVHNNWMENNISAEEAMKKISDYLSPLKESKEISNQKRYFDYLNMLRDSGLTNMFGAAPYLQNEFDLDKRKAREILANYMKSFNEGTCGYDRDVNGKKLKGPGGLNEKIGALVKEKLTKKHDVGDFVDDFKKSDAKQFKGKSAKKKKEMAVAAYLSKQNEK